MTLVAVGLAAPVHAESPRVAVLLGGPEDAQRLEIETRLRSELRIAGFDIVLVDAGAAGRDSLEQAVKSTGSFAAIGVVRQEGLGADVWVVDHVTGKAVQRRIVFGGASDDAAAIFAIRAVELLRASLLELTEPHPSRGTIPPAPELRAWVTPPRKTTASASHEAHVGAALLAGPGGIPPSFAPFVQGSWEPLPTWAGGVEALGPALASLDGREGEARVDQEFVTAFVRVQPWRSRWIAPFARLSLGAYHLGASGRAKEGYASQGGSTWALATAPGMGLKTNGPGPLSLLASLDAFLLTPRPVVRFASRRVASTGHPTLVGQLAIGVQW
jgi:hypothetical protein